MLELILQRGQRSRVHGVVHFQPAAISEGFPRVDLDLAHQDVQHHGVA
jgi:hypothetical protein